jgi:hypothetical protein
MFREVGRFADVYILQQIDTQIASSFLTSTGQSMSDIAIRRS